jgi:hypothetical protein
MLGLLYVRLKHRPTVLLHVFEAAQKVFFISALSSSEQAETSVTKDVVRSMASSHTLKYTVLSRCELYMN